MRTTYFDSDYSGCFPRENYYVEVFGVVPNTTFIPEVLGTAIVDKLKEEGFDILWQRRNVNYNCSYVSSEVYKKGKVLVYLTPEHDQETYDLKGMSCTFLHQNYSDIEAIVNYFQTLLIKPVKTGSISLISTTSTGALTTVEFPTKMKEFDIELHYGKVFRPTYDKIISRLNTKFDKGLVLFHGSPGTGKTSLIKLMSRHIKDKEVIFCPPYMVDQIGSPQFIPFLLNHPHAILIIEDAERVLLSRDSSGASSNGVSSILNITDGILGDCLNIQVVATFNTSRDKIDAALLRTGRLIALHEFSELNVEDSNLLLKHINKDYTAIQPMTLASIYGLGDEAINTKKDSAPIGFNSKRY
jgi:hypothetical protein